MAPLAALAVPLIAGAGELGTAAAAGTAAAGTGAAGAAAGGGIGLGTILPVIGTAATVVGSIASGIAGKNQADFQAKEERRAAADKLASATRQADDTRRRTNILMSNEKAAAAASGAGVTNPTVLDILSDTAGRGEFLQASDLYNGQSAAASDLDQAALLKKKGSNLMTGSWLDALGEGALGGYKTGKSAGFFS
jgi:hypothetical protein